MYNSLNNHCVVGVLLTLGVATSLQSTRASKAITSRMYFGFASTEYPRAVLTITLPRKNIRPPSRTCHPTMRIKTGFHQSQKFDARARQQSVIHMNENIDVQVTISETARICQVWVVIRTFQESHNTFVPQFAVLCDIHTPLRAASKPHLHTISDHSGASANNSWSMPACRNAVCVRQVQLRCSRVLGHCFDHASTQPTLFSVTVSMVSVQTSRAECALDHD